MDWPYSEEGGKQHHVYGHGVEPPGKEKYPVKFQIDCGARANIYRSRMQRARSSPRVHRQW